jgi:aminoglycoside 3-N-acetyltransferase
VTDVLNTRSSLAAELRALGVRPASVLLVHSSMRALGWVCGGPLALAQAVCDVLGPDGTLVVPTHTPDNSDPANWRNPPVPEDWWPVIRAEMPGFDTTRTPSRWMGSFAEVIRTWPGARRSDHPEVSFAALGPRAAEITEQHRREDGLGETSPLGMVYASDGDILLLGVGHGSNTSLHLAEYRVPAPPRKRQAAAVLTETGREWVSWEDVDVDEEDFDRLGDDFDATGAVTIGGVGAATCRLMRQRAAVDYAVGWFRQNRG